MISLKNVLAIARAETRLTRRLVRYWVFMCLAMLVGIGYFAYTALIHHFYSAYSATVSAFNCRWLIGAIGLYYQMVFLIGLIFLGFDVRARDRRERMDEVLDSLPCTNMELVFGKFVGVLIPSWVPLLVLALGFLITGLITGKMVEPYSLVTFLTLSILPSFAFALALVYFCTLLVRNRWIGALLILVVLGGIFTAGLMVPLWMSPAFDFAGGFLLPFPSDMTPSSLELEGWIHRGAFLLCAVGLLVLGAAVHPRRDDGSRTVRAGSGLALFLVGAVLLGGIAMGRKGTVTRVADWKDAHQQRSAEPAPDMDALSATVTVDPGDRIEVEAALEFRAPADGQLDAALFSLNPGFTVEEVRDAGGALEFTHEKGLLEIDLPSALPAGESRTVTVRYAGAPDVNFAYLDSVKNLLEINAMEGQVFLLGDLPAFFERRLVALMPGVRWLPASGAEIGRNDPKVRPTDFYRLDMTVEVPGEWTAVAVGRRQEMDGAGEGRAAFRFAPANPVPEVALLAGKFTSRSTEIDGVLAEVLVHPSHEKNLEVFADAVDPLVEWLEEKLQNGADVGLDYPYDSITLVEVPNRLRGFGGGWRLDTTLAPPSQVLMRESGFPTAEFERHFQDENDFQDTEGGMPAAKRDFLVRFFDNDFSGGNPFVGSTRNFFTNQTAGTGPEGLPLDFVFEDASRRLVTDKQAYFSAFLFDSDMGQIINQSLGSFFTGGAEGEFAEALVEATTGRTAVWDTVLDTSLSELDPWEDPEDAIDVLTLKAGAMSRSMLDELGREETGKVMASLREGSLGSSFGREEVLEAGRGAGVDLEPWLDVWINQTDLPGFRVADSDAYRLEDTEDGSPRYQALVTVVNEEDVPGLVRVEYSIRRDQSQPDTGSSGPVRVPPRSAVQVGLVASAAPRALSVVPYLSLNRRSFVIQLPEVDEENVREVDPFRGDREVPWTPEDTGIVVVDDLDPGFRVEEEEAGGLRLRGKKDEDEDMDHGIPTFNFQRRPTRWSRLTHRNAYGKYRHTLALVRAGDGDRVAIFEAELPRGGSWDLELFLPSREGRGLRIMRQMEEWNLVVEDESGPREVTFDAANGEGGWNTVGTYEVAEGKVLVKFSNETEGRNVIADAIRWVPSPDNGRTVEEGS